MGHSLHVVKGDLTSTYGKASWHSKGRIVPPEAKDGLAFYPKAESMAKIGGTERGYWALVTFVLLVLLLNG